tara:strand:- start:286 stop:996 length:711 start_codon:yes stop_codon:yes gene_type:complete
MTENKKDLSTKSHIQFMEPIFNKQYTVLLHHDIFHNFHHGTAELIEYPYFRHYGFENTLDPREPQKINYSNIKNLLDPLYFLDAIHKEQDGWAWFFKTTELPTPPPGIEKQKVSIKISCPAMEEHKKRPIEHSHENQSHKKPKINPYANIIHACSSQCCISFPHSTPKSKLFTTPTKWCGVCITEYDIDKMFKIINSGDGNKTFISYKIENKKWMISDFEIILKSDTPFEFLPKLE